MKTIKTWQERGDWDKNFVPQYDGMPAWEAIKAENVDLRAALAKQADAAPVSLSPKQIGDMWNEAKNTASAEMLAPMIFTRAIDTALAQRVVSEAVPYGWILETGHGEKFGRTKPNCEVDLWKPVSLLNSPPAAPVALSDAQIWRIAGDVKQRNAGVWPGDVAFARAILAAATQPTNADKRDAVACHFKEHQLRILCSALDLFESDTDSIQDNATAERMNVYLLGKADELAAITASTKVPK